MHAPIAMFALGCNPIQRSTLGYRTDRESRTNVMVTKKNKRLAKNRPVPRGLVPLIPLNSGGVYSTEPTTSISQLVADFVDSATGEPRRLEILNQIIGLAERREQPTMLQLKKLIPIGEYKALRRSFETRLLDQSKVRCPVELVPYINLLKQADGLYMQPQECWQDALSTGLLISHARKCQATYQAALECLVNTFALHPGIGKFLDRQVAEYYPSGDCYWNVIAPRLLPARSRRAVERVAQDERERRELIVATLNVSVTRLKSS